MAYLKRADILSVDDIKTEEVEVPEWGGTVIMKMLNGIERDAFEASCVDVENGKPHYRTDNIRAKLVARSIIDPDTKELMFTVGDIDALGRKSASALVRLFEVAQRLSGLSDDDVQALAKNSSPVPADSSITN